jgi:hypothetical protein
MMPDKALQPTRGAAVPGGRVAQLSSTRIGSQGVISSPVTQPIGDLQPSLAIALPLTDKPSRR